MKKLLLATVGLVLLSGAAASAAPARPVQFDVPPPVAPLTDCTAECDTTYAWETYTRE
jgi:hypothetical protein